MLAHRHIYHFTRVCLPTPVIAAIGGIFAFLLYHVVLTLGLDFNHVGCVLGLPDSVERHDGEGVARVVLEVGNLEFVQVAG